MNCYEVILGGAIWRFGMMYFLILLGLGAGLEAQTAQFHELLAPYGYILYIYFLIRI